MTTPSQASRVLRVAVVTDDSVSAELHQTRPGAVSVGTSIGADLLVFGESAPKFHQLFGHQRGTYYLDLPANARGKVRLGKRAMTVSRLRERYGKGGRCRITLDPRTKGKLRIGQSTVLFQFAPPKPEPPKLPFPTMFKASLVGMVGAAFLYSQLASAGLLGPFFVWLAVADVPQEVEVEIDDRFIAIIGTKFERPDEQKEDDRDPDKDALADAAEPQPRPQERQKQKPRRKKTERSAAAPTVAGRGSKRSAFSEKAVAEARSVGVARVLGTYGGDAPGSVFDVIQSTDNRLGELMKGGMNVTVEANGPIGDLAPVGGDGIDLHGTMLASKKLDTGSRPGLAAKHEKRERKIQGRAKALQTSTYGGGDAKALRATIKHRTSALQHCYNRALQTQPGLAGKMTYTIMVSVMGNVTRVTVEQDTVGSPSVTSCAKAKIKGWRFPMSGADSGAEVTFSVVFSGG